MQIESEDPAANLPVVQSDDPMSDSAGQGGDTPAGPVTVVPRRPPDEHYIGSPRASDAKLRHELEVRARQFAQAEREEETQRAAYEIMAN